MSKKPKRSVKAVVVCGAVVCLAASMSGCKRESVKIDLFPGSWNISETSSDKNVAAGLEEVPTKQIHLTDRTHLNRMLEEGVPQYKLPEVYEREGGSFPAELQQYTYSVCGNYGVEYELVLAMIEVESAYCNNAVSNCGAVGYMQIVEKWHKDRMERLNVEDLNDPYSNIIVGIDYMAELLEQYPEEVALGVYNMGYKAVDFWKNGGIITQYAKAVLSRKMEIFMENTAEEIGSNE